MNYCKYCMEPLRNGEVTCPNCSSDSAKTIPAHRLLPGTVLNGRYRIGKVLGEGGFGITYIGRDMKLDMKVAVKEYYPNGLVNRNNTFSPTVNCSVSADKEAFFINGRKKFVQEARILAKFSKEPGIVEVRDFFESNNTAYIIMEYLDGQDLKQFLKANGALPVPKAIQTLVPVMKSLTEIHKHGLLHRDISPDNIRLTPNGVKLLDFGAAREMTTQINQSISVMLKPGYAPEEQYRSKGIQGPWTDVYAVCATLYKCITGITPDDAAQRSYSDELQKPSLLGVRISPATESVIMKGLSVRQQDRYQTMEELLNALLASLNAVSTKSGIATVGPSSGQNTDKTVHIGVPNEIKPSPITGPSAAPVYGGIKRTAPSYSPPITNPPVTNPPAPRPPVQKPQQNRDAKTKKIIAFVIIGIVALFMLTIGVIVAISIIGASSYTDTPPHTYVSTTSNYIIDEPLTVGTNPELEVLLYEAQGISKEYINALLSNYLKSFSHEIINRSTIENTINQVVLSETQSSSLQDAYAAYSSATQTNITNADDLMNYYSNTLITSNHQSYGDDFEIVFNSVSTDYVTEGEVQPYIQALNSGLNSLSAYGLSADSVDLSNIEQYAKVDASIDLKGSIKTESTKLTIVLGYTNNEWKVIYCEEINDPYPLWSLYVLQKMSS